MQDAPADLIDQVYEAAFVPEVWNAVLGRMASMSEGFGTVLFTLNASDFRWLSSPAIQEDMAEFVRSWANRNTRSARVLAKRHAGFVGELDIYTRAELDAEPMYTEFLRPRGLGWGAATIVQVTTGDTLIFSMERKLARGPVEQPFIDRLDALRPHLARAALIAARLRLERAKAAADTLQAMGLAAAVLGGSGRVLASNSLLDKVTTQIISGADGRLILASRTANAMLAEALGRLESGTLAAHVQSIPLPATSEHAPAIIHLLPIRGVAHDIFAGGLTLAVVTQIAPGNVVAAEVLESLFDLSPAEARVARGIGAGQTIETLADALGVSRETIRNQLKAVFDKTGVNRQGDLIGLLAKSSPKEGA